MTVVMDTRKGMWPMTTAKLADGCAVATGTGLVAVMVLTEVVAVECVLVATSVFEGQVVQGAQ